MIDRIWTRRKPGRETTVAHLELARANQEQVLAVSAIKGERMVAIVRLVLFALMGVSQGGIAPLYGEREGFDPVQGWAIKLYMVFSVLAVIGLHLQEPNPRRSRWMPVPTALADIGFVTVMTWRSWVVTGHFNVEMLGVSGAVLLAFSVTRFSRFHVLLSTLLTVAAFMGLSAATGNFFPGRVSYVVVCYLVLGALLYRVNIELRSMFLDLRRRDSLSRFLPRQVVERIVKHGDASLMPVQREVTILFSDIRDFTSLSETLPPQAVLKLLDDYFEHMTQIVMARGGMVNKFLGDGMLACWGVPDHAEDHAEQAMRAALDMRAKLVELNAWREQRGEPPLRIGIGLHTGVVAAGMLGGAQQHEYTIIGDAVNVASRVEGLTKALGVDILVSESTWKRGGERFHGELMGEERVKGRQEAVVLYALKGREVAPSTAFPEERTGTAT
jgi:adenylate cyclase